MNVESRCKQRLRADEAVSLISDAAGDVMKTSSGARGEKNSNLSS
jgi:hypothetical protein